MPFESVAVPFQVTPDGRKFLELQQVCDNKDLQRFVEAFPACFEYDPQRRLYWFFENGKE